MALASLPPWLHPPDYLSAIRSGAELGTSRARISQAAEEAAGRLGLSYASLASHERQSANSLAAHRQQNAEENALRKELAGDALRERQNESLARLTEMTAQHAEELGHHKEAEKIATAAQTLRERAQSFREQHDNTQYTLTPGSIRFDAKGNKIVDNPSRSALERSTVGYDIPAIEGKDAVPADSGKRSLLGLDFLAKDVPPTPAIPAVFARPVIHVHRPATEQDLSSASAALAPQPAPVDPLSTAPMDGYVLRDKSTGKTFRYKGDPNEVPQDRYELVQ